MDGRGGVGLRPFDIRPEPSRNRTLPYSGQQQHSGADPSTHANAGPDARPRTDADTRADTHPSTGTQPHAWTNASTHANLGPGAHTHTDAHTGIHPYANAHTRTNTKTSADTDPSTDAHITVGRRHPR